LRLVFEGHAPLMNFLAQIGVPQPEVLRAAGRFVLGADLRDTVEQDIPDPSGARALLENARRWNIPVDAEGVEVAINSAILHRAEQLAINPDDAAAMESLLTLADVAHSMPFPVNFWRAQNVYFSLLKNRLPEKRAEANRGNEDAKEWINKFLRLGQALKIRMEQ
jgi:hypothetical protein